MRAARISCTGNTNEGRQRTSIFLLWLLLACLTAASDAASLESRADESSRAGELPVFVQTASNVSAFEGQTVYLPCRVHNLADKVVSWMRSRDLHILTSDRYTFSSDDRFELQHLAGSDAWTLKLDRVRKSDAGRYECQVNTEPKAMYAVQLTVRDPARPDGHDEPHSQQTRISYESTAPVAAIMGPREQVFAAGSTVTLRCVVTSPYQIRPVKGVQWLRDGRLLTFQAARGGINVETVTGTAQTFSEATLANVTRRDSGKYSCRPAEGKTDTISVSVRDSSDERTEAMQRDAPYVSSFAAALETVGRLYPCIILSYATLNVIFIHHRTIKILPVLLFISFK